MAALSDSGSDPIELCRAAESSFCQADMAVYARVAALGAAAVRGDREAQARHVSWIGEQRVREPARLARMLAPELQRTLSLSDPQPGA